MRSPFQTVLSILGAGTLAAGCGSSWTTPFSRGTPPPTAQELADRIESLEAKRARDQQAVADAQKNERSRLEERLGELEEAIGGLRSELAAARSDREALEKELEGLRESAQDEQGAAARRPPAQVGDQDAAELARGELDLAKALLAEGKPSEARQAVKRILNQRLPPDLAGQAQLFLGETHFLQQQYGEAILAYHRIVEEYPSAPEAPQAILKEATCFAMLGRDEDASFLFEKLLRDYPDSAEAREVMEEQKNEPAPEGAPPAKAAAPPPPAAPAAPAAPATP